MGEVRDEATGLFSRAFFDAELERLSRARGVNVGIVVCDVEPSDKTTESFNVEAEFTGILKSSFRESDVVAKLSTNEFGVIIEDVTEDTVVKATERLLKKVESYNSKNVERKISVYANWSMSGNFFGDARKTFEKLHSSRNKH
ncbi:MAG: GGDEF domain-containing protein [Caldisericaceae bacterium]